MKIWGFIIVTILSVQFSFGQSKKELRKQKELEKEASIKKLIEDGNFTFNVYSASTYNGRTINNLSSYDLTIKNDSVFAYLPYFGRAFTADFSSDGGIDLANTMNHLEKKEIKKRYQISFEAEDENKRNYDIILSIGKSGYADLTVRPENKSIISYDGKIEKIEEE
ncbi:hypothetical protein UJ101_01847 [Flavobacteriaceae bacterium UJ101]|nr:hypothetical protein UJ101_01847 [Flavobacteriaceae bacterium UJ101]